MKNGTRIPYSPLPRPVIAASHALQSHWHRALASCTLHSTAEHVCTTGTWQHHYYYLLGVIAKASQNTRQTVSIPTGLIFQTDLLGGKKKRKERKKKTNLFNISPKLFSLSQQRSSTNPPAPSMPRASCWSSTNRGCSETAPNREKTQTKSSQKETFPDVQD